MEINTGVGQDGELYTNLKMAIESSLHYFVRFLISFYFSVIRCDMCKGTTSPNPQDMEEYN